MARTHRQWHLRYEHKGATSYVYSIYDETGAQVGFAYVNQPQFHGIPPAHLKLPVPRTAECADSDCLNKFIRRTWIHIYCSRRCRNRINNRVYRGKEKR